MSLMEDARRRAALEAEARRLGIDVVTLEMAKAVPTSLVQDIVRDSRGGVSPPSSLAGPTRAEPVKRTVAVERPLGPPPGIEHVDRIANAFDAADRRRLEAIEKLRKDR